MFTKKTGQLPPETRAEIFAALHVNPNAREISRKVGVSAMTVWRMAQQEGIKLTGNQTAVGRGRAQIPGKTRAKIIEELKANPNAYQVAKQVGGVSAMTVWTIAKRAGIELAARRAARNEGWMARRWRSARKPALEAR